MKMGDNCFLKLDFAPPLFWRAFANLDKISYFNSLRGIE